MFDLITRGDTDAAMDIWWEPAPTRERSAGLEAYFHTGVVTALTDKYAHWCNGGNGGSVRQPTPRLYDYQKEAIRSGLRTIGLTPREPEEEFYVGRVNYAKGARLPIYAD
jgi:4-hydroxy-tetrahydrodipicolinate synthase